MKETRQYGLFEKQNGTWVDIAPTLHFKKSVAVKVFQNALLAPYFNGIDGDKIKGIRELHVVK